MEGNVAGKEKEEVKTQDERSNSGCYHTPLLSFFSNRICVCSLAIALLWATSLQTSISLVRLFIVSPPATKVLSSCEYAYEQIDRQRVDYKECAADQTDLCFNLMDERISVEESRVDFIYQQSQEITEALQQLDTNCSSSLSWVHDSFSTWRAGGMDYTIPYYDISSLNGANGSAEVCTTDDLQKVKNYLGDANTVPKSAVYAQSLNFASAAEARVSHLADYISELNEYNAQYLTNKTSHLRIGLERMIQEISMPHISSLNATFLPLQGLLDIFVACMGSGNDSNIRSTSSGSGDSLYSCEDTGNNIDDYSYSSSMSPNNGNKKMCCPYGHSARSLYDAIQREMNVQKLIAQSTLSSFKQEVDDFKSRVQGALARADSFYDSIVGARGIIMWIVNTFQLQNTLCGKSTPDWCTFSKSDWYVYPPTLPSIPTLYNAPGASAIWNTIENVALPHLAVNLSLPSIQALQISKKWESDLRNAISGENMNLNFDLGLGFEDYNPPPYSYSESNNASDEKLAQKSQSSTFLADLEANLNPPPPTSHLNDTSFLNGIRNDASLNSSTLNAGSLQSILISEFQALYLPISFEGVSLEKIKSLFAFLRSLLLLFDFIYRIVHTLRLLDRYWSKSAVDLPVADVRETQKEFQACSIIGYLNQIFSLLPYVWLQLCMLIGSIIAIVWILATLYIPLYQSYINGCVHKTSNETFISGHAHVISFNVAALNGNGVIESKIAAYNAKSASTCSTKSQTSHSKLSMSITAIHKYNESLMTHIHTSSLLNRCVNLDELNDAFATACCNTMESSKFQSTSSSISSSSSSSSSSLMKDSISYYFDPSFGVCNVMMQQNANNLTTTSDRNPAAWTHCPTYEQLFGPAIPYLPPQIYLLRDSACAINAYNEAIFLNLSFNSIPIPSYSNTTINSSSSTSHFLGVPYNRPILDGVDTFNCNAIPQCKISCNGPDKGVIETVVKNCSCYGEWAIHSTILQCFVGIWVFICMNASRMWIISGIVRLSWKKLTPKVFEYRGDCALIEEGIPMGEEGQQTKGKKTCELEDSKMRDVHTNINANDDVNADVNANVNVKVKKGKTLNTFQPTPESIRSLNVKFEHSLKWFAW